MGQSGGPLCSLAGELERQREQTARELSDIRESLRAVHQRECDALREARGTAYLFSKTPARLYKHGEGD